jgi:hypothetical protein
MPYPVFRKRSQAQPRRLVFPSLLGDGMPERLRSTSIALIGTVAAVGLGTVAFALQLGLPAVVSGPLPEPPPKRHAIGELVAARGAPSARLQHSAPPPDPSPVAPPVRKPSEGTVLVTGDPPAQSRAERPTPPQPGPVQSLPAETPPAAPPPVEPAASASEVPPPAEAAPETPAPTHPGNGNAYGKGSGNGVGNGGEPPGQVAKAARQDEEGE